MKKKWTIICIVCMLIIALICFVKKEKKVYTYSSTYNAYTGTIKATIEDYKIIRILFVENIDIKGKSIKRKIILTNEEWNAIQNIEKLTEENEEGIIYLKIDELVRYLNILSHDQEIYVLKNPITGEEIKYISREYADDYLNNAYKTFNFTIPKEYTHYYLEKKGFDFAYHSTEDLRRATKTITDFIYTDVITQKKYANFIDIWLNEDESITIQYYGVSRDKFGSSFTQTVEKYNSNTKEYLKYVFSYDKDLDKWSYQEIKNNKGE